MDSARYCIDNDDDYHLKLLPSANELLKIGLTLYVDKDFPKFHDMTLIQYAIAKRKPKTLKYMLEKCKEMNIDYKDIMYPKTSNTRGSLLRLSIEFGSKVFYDTVDNSCLIAILEEFDIANLDSTNLLCYSLLLSIEHENEEAFKILINKGANFTDQLGNDDNEISYDELLETSIMKLFISHNDKDQLHEIFDKYFSENGDAIIKKLLKLKIEN